MAGTVVAAVLAAALAVPAGGTGAGPAAVPAPLSPSFFGMHAISVPPSGIPGVASVRLWDTDTTWRILNPRRGVYRWRTLDARVAAAEAAGASVLLVLGATPPWAARRVDARDAPWLGPGSASSPRRLADWSAFVSAVADRYAGRIEAYQVWNEPALRIFWRGSAATLARMTRVARDVIRAADPAATVVAAPLVVRGRHWQAAGARYLAALRHEGWPVDALAFHGYAGGDTGPSGLADAVVALKSVLAEVGAPPLPLWETEVNFTRGRAGAPPGEVPDPPAWLARTYLDGARMGIARIYWYAYAQVPAFLSVDIRRPAVSRAYAAVSAWITGARLVGCEPAWNGTAGVTGCSYVDRLGRSGVALWSTRPQQVVAGRGRVSDLDGRTWSVGGTVAVGTAPLWFAPAAQAA